MSYEAQAYKASQSQAISVTVTSGPPGTGRITGSVRDATTNGLISAGRIYLSSPYGDKDLTFSGGFFNIDNVTPSSQCTLTAEADDYQSQMKPAPVTAGQVTTVDFQLQPTVAAGWDVRTTDLWVYAEGVSGLLPFNILQGQVPMTPAGTPLRVDARLKNFGVSAVNVRLVAQVVSLVAPDQRYGDVIYTDFQPIAPGAEVVLSHWVNQWAEDIYIRLWVDNADLPVGNCPAGVPPPWSGCRQGELFDFLKSSRHLVWCKVYV